MAAGPRCEPRCSKRAEESPHLIRKLTVDRNLRWMPQVEKVLQDKGGDYTVVTGALHMVGRDGLVEMFRRKGYKLVIKPDPFDSAGWFAAGADIPGFAGVAEILHDTQRTTQANGDITMVMWMPQQFWEEAMKGNPALTDEGRAQVHGAAWPTTRYSA
ncbi:MAG: TraB/GumN family protein [Proteobacteria bacterium]|nr:TraB/GumN family protein [Pseudomonadota bacterium]